MYSALCEMSLCELWTMGSLYSRDFSRECGTVQKVLKPFSVKKFEGWKWDERERPVVLVEQEEECGSVVKIQKLKFGTEPRKISEHLRVIKRL